LTSPEVAESIGAEATTGVILTAVAIEKVQTLLVQEGRSDLRLRLAVQPGGCSGLRYQLFFDDRSFDDDLVIRFGDSSDRVPESESGYDSGYESDFDDAFEDGPGTGPAQDVDDKLPSFDVAIDRKSVPYLTGATINFVDELQRSGFIIDNPNAGGSCACGDSFH
jgi:Fe-S cluster assembly iron-binding protein IscA